MMMDKATLKDALLAAPISIGILAQLNLIATLQELNQALKIFNYFFTTTFCLEAALKVVALGPERYFSEKWNQLDMAIVALSVLGITLEEIEVELIY